MTAKCLGNEYMRFSEQKEKIMYDLLFSMSYKFFNISPFLVAPEM